MDLIDRDNLINNLSKWMKLHPNCDWYIIDIMNLINNEPTVNHINIISENNNTEEIDNYE